MSKHCRRRHHRARKRVWQARAIAYKVEQILAAPKPPEPPDIWRAALIARMALEIQQEENRRILELLVGSRWVSATNAGDVIVGTTGSAGPGTRP